MKKVKVSKKKMGSGILVTLIIFTGVASALLLPPLISTITNPIVDSFETKQNRSGFDEAPEELVAVYKKSEENEKYTVQAEIEVYGNEKYIVRERGSYIFTYAEDCTQKIKDDTRDEIGYRYFDPLHKEERIVEEWNGDTLTITFDLSYRDGSEMITKTLLRIYDQEAPSMALRKQMMKKEGFKEA
mgnify:CR=1 FL=1